MSALSVVWTDVFACMYLLMVCCMSRIQVFLSSLDAAYSSYISGGLDSLLIRNKPRS